MSFAIDCRGLRRYRCRTVNWSVGEFRKMSWRDVLKRAFWSPAPYLCWVALTVFFALSGPFGTYVRFSLLRRVAYFAILIGVCIAWGVTARALIQSRFPTMSFPTASLIVSAVSAIVLAEPILSFTIFMSGGNGPHLPSLIELSGLILVIGLVVASVRWALTYGFTTGAVATSPGDPPDEPAEQVDAPAPVIPRLLSRLADGLQGGLVRISARDHYVDVVTDKGSSQLLLRLSDAIAELDGVDGLRVHRSHWVAAAAVVGQERKGEKRFLVLSDGARVPVSRNHHADVAARGLI
jgi:LytTr DNA-binding domain